MLQIRSENKLNIRLNLLHLRLLGQQRGLRIRGAIIQKESNCFSAAIFFTDGLQSVSVWRGERVCLHCLFFLSPRCQTLGLLLGSGCRCCHWLFGHCRQLKPFNDIVLFLAVVAGVVLTDMNKSFFLLPDCASLCWWCLGQCCAVTSLETDYLLFVLLCYYRIL